MAHRFKKGDRVEWNSEAGVIVGVVVRVVTEDAEFLGRTRHASAEEPQYEVTSDKTGRHAMHKESALREHA